MTIEIIEVIDTAVKVGLGALISGVTTYYVTRLNHKEDKNKEFLKKKLEIIAFSIERMEKYFDIYFRYWSALEGYLRVGIPPGAAPEKVYDACCELDEELVTARSDRSIAISRLRLIGENDAAKAIVKINQIENDFRNQIIFKRALPSEAELHAYGKDMSSVKLELYELLRKAHRDSFE